MTLEVKLLSVVVSVVFCIVGVSGQGVNLKVPLPLVDDFLGSNTDKDHEDRWWFWVIIGIIAAFFVVSLFFTVRGFLRYRMLKKQEERDESRLPEHYGHMGRRISSDYIHSIHDDAVGTVKVRDDPTHRDILRRCAILSPGNTLGAMVPDHGSASLDATRLHEQIVMQKINPRMALVPLHTNEAIDKEHVGF